MPFPTHDNKRPEETLDGLPPYNTNDTGSNSYYIVRSAQSSLLELQGSPFAKSYPQPVVMNMKGSSIRAKALGDSTFHQNNVEHDEVQQQAIALQRMHISYPTHPNPRVQHSFPVAEDYFSPYAPMQDTCIPPPHTTRQIDTRRVVNSSSPHGWSPHERFYFRDGDVLFRVSILSQYPIYHLSSIYDRFQTFFTIFIWMYSEPTQSSSMTYLLLSDSPLPRARTHKKNPSFSPSWKPKSSIASCRSFTLWLRISGTEEPKKNGFLSFPSRLVGRSPPYARWRSNSLRLWWAQKRNPCLRGSLMLRNGWFVDQFKKTWWNNDRQDVGWYLVHFFFSFLLGIKAGN